MTRIIKRQPASPAPDDQADLGVARQLIKLGIPVFAAPPVLDADGQWNPHEGVGGYRLPTGWQRTVPDEGWLDPAAPGFEETAWREGWALGAVMGQGLDLLDVDPRSGGDASRAELEAKGIWPVAYAEADSPSGGTHDFIAPLAVASRDDVLPGLDIKAGLADGTGRGFAFIAPTVKLSKATGEPARYTWRKPLTSLPPEGSDSSGLKIAELVREKRASKSKSKSLRARRGGSGAESIAAGERHAQFVSYAGQLLARGVAPEEAAILMERHWQRAEQPRGDEYPLEQALADLEDVYGRYEAGRPAERPWDAGETLPTEPPSWAANDLSNVLDGSWVPPEATLFPRSDGQGLLYPGLVHSFHGESESGKSLLMQIQAANLVQDGQDVLFIDFESDAGSVANRLLTFGATAPAILKHFTYIRPDVRPGSSLANREAFRGMLERPYAVAVIDGVTDALSVFGYETNDNDGITSWMRELPKRIADRTGAAVVIIDHVVKDSSNRGRYAVGGQAKMNALTGAAYVIEIVEPLGQGQRGVIAMRIGKDRAGALRNKCGPWRKSDRTQEAARVVIDSTAAMPVVTVQSWDDVDEERPFRPTALMEKVSRAVEATAGMTKNRILDEVGGKKQMTFLAVNCLVQEGYVAVQAGKNNSQMHTHVSEYREAADPRSDKYRPDAGESVAGTTRSESQVVSGSGPYTGEPGTTLKVVPEPLGEPPGTTTTRRARGDVHGSHEPAATVDCCGSGCPPEQRSTCVTCGTEDDPTFDRAASG